MPTACPGELSLTMGKFVQSLPLINSPIICLNSNFYLAFVGGAIVGTVVGAMKGQTTETGFFRGAGIGAVTGAITAVQLLESLADGESLSKV